MKKVIMMGCEPNRIIEIFQDTQSNVYGHLESTVVEPRILQLIDTSKDCSDEKYLLVNMDIHENMNLSSYEGYTVITIGFNKKASITVSSALEGGIVFCIQREINTKDKVIEPQDIVSKEIYGKSDEVLSSLFVFSALLILV